MGFAIGFIVGSFVMYFARDWVADRIDKWRDR